MATQADLDQMLTQHPTLFDDGLFLDNEAALRFYSGNESKIISRRAIPLDEFQASVEWMESRKLRKDAGDRTSHDWKQVMERATRNYVSNGAFIAAALFLEVPMVHEQDTPHPTLGFKDQKGDF